MKTKLIKALILESKGYFLSANELYSKILSIDPQNETAQKGEARMREKIAINIEKLELFMSEDKDDIKEFERWLIKI